MFFVIDDGKFCISYNSGTEVEQVDLFEYMRNSNMEKESPLASRLRPTTLEEVAGQKHIAISHIFK